MNINTIGIVVSLSLSVVGCQNSAIKQWDQQHPRPSLHIGNNTENVIKISYDISSANQGAQTEYSLKRLQKNRDWVNQLSQQSKTVEQFKPVKLDNIDTVNPNAYLYIDEYNVRLGKVRVGLGAFADYRVASLGSSDKTKIYSNIQVYNCSERSSITAITYTYTANTDETQVFAPESTWETPRQGTAQRWLMNAVCSATLVETDDSSLAVGYSVLLNQLG
ncbi:hypothetical protein FHQ28_05860 [Pasteurellaceae bacterium USgator11]|nr:hypothetical protein FHQ19_07930 [Pasteurellaceae bacterium UScroc12]TNG98552.1 hypothetical protein FHQ20_00530 [Pasteurellaceae bacterium USgator41]TNH00256.1 hypothetical protein FHQ24_04190 [Pasteurellaceae bacterium UScroc31]TNH01478.1 hypothetical protein FHQ28_05860 [Pasteurellaceae bacterium USgator11]